MFYDCRRLARALFQLPILQNPEKGELNAILICQCERQDAHIQGKRLQRTAKTCFTS